MTSSNIVTAQFQSFFKKKIKFDQVIAKDIGVWCDARFVSFINIVDDAFFIFFTKIKNDKSLDSQVFSDLECAISINTSGAVRIVWIRIIFHKTCNDFISLLYEKMRSDGWVYTSRKSDKNFFSISNHTVIYLFEYKKASDLTIFSSGLDFQVWDSYKENILQVYSSGVERKSPKLRVASSNLARPVFLLIFLNWR